MTKTSKTGRLTKELHVRVTPEFKAKLEAREQQTSKQLGFRIGLSQYIVRALEEWLKLSEGGK